MAGAALLGAMCFSFIGLAGCDGGGSATPARSHSGQAAADSDSRQGAWGNDRGDQTGPAADRSDRPSRTARTDDTPMHEGRPMWSDNRRHTAQENAQYQFERHGEELGARTLDAFVSKAHAFVTSPPASTLSMTRGNGDRLMFDPQSGLFAVARKDGAPRTVFKPDDGMAYWRAQEAAVRRDEGGADRSARTQRSASDEADS